MSRDTQPSIDLEVTVPRIILPSIDVDRLKDTVKSDEELEQVRLSSIDIQDPQRPPQSHEQQCRQGEASTYTSWRGLFRLFRIKAIPMQRWATLVQVLRKSSRQTKSDAADFQVTESLPCKIEYQYVTTNNSPLHIEVIPGLTRVVIVLDEDGIPITYNVDGSEN